MSRTLNTAFAAALLIPVVLGSTGCLRGGSAVQELAEEVVAEAIVTQSISSYNEASINISVNDVSLAMSCNNSGSLDWSELEESEFICYEVDSKGCSFETGSGASFSIEGTSEMCGADTFAINGETLEQGQEYTLAGSATVSTSNDSRTCDYDLHVAVESVLGGGASYSVLVEGSLCGNAEFSSSFEIEVEANVEVELE